MAKYKHRDDDFFHFIDLKDDPFEKVIAELAPDAPDPDGLLIAAYHALELGDEPIPDQRPALHALRKAVLELAPHIAEGIFNDPDRFLSAAPTRRGYRRTDRYRTRALA